MINLVEKVKFKDFIDFVNKRKKLRIYYVLLSYKEKRELKQYIYKLNYKENIKDVMWRYLNETRGSIDYVFDYELLEYMKYYARKNLTKSKNSDII